jgi:hypothetical protein
MTNATSVINEISGALDQLGNQVLAQIGDDRPLMEIWGWNNPALTRNDIADVIRGPKDLIARMEFENVTEADLIKLKAYPQRIQWVLGNVLPNMPGGNAHQAYGVIHSLIDGLEVLLGRYACPDWDIASIEEKNLLPAAQIKRLKNFDKAIERLGYEQSAFEKKINDIDTAHALAESLPADMQMLQDARAGYELATKDVDKSGEHISQLGNEAEVALARLNDIKSEAEAVLIRANEAYSAATTVGLGQAFSDRAKSLSSTTLTLGVFLLIALSIGAYITYNRVEFVHTLMLKEHVDYNVLWINVTFTALSVSAPVWLSWLLTRQIGQRFRLAEDYSYKATVAKAYEGYRAQASHIDPELSKRLFSIALDMLGEAPLRLVEKESPGSPAHEAAGPVGWFFGFGRKSASREKDGGG